MFPLLTRIPAWLLAGLLAFGAIAPGVAQVAPGLAPAFAPAAVAPKQPLESFAAKVVGVIDGDTVDVLREVTETINAQPIKSRRQVRIRLHGIDAPEKGQDFGTQAKTQLSQMVMGKPVTVEVLDTDRYGRLIGRVWVTSSPRQDVGARLVGEGLAWAYVAYSSDYVAHEQQARQQRRGQWRLLGTRTELIPPWDWRKGVRFTATGRYGEETAQGGGVAATGRYSKTGGSAPRPGSYASGPAGRSPRRSPTYTGRPLAQSVQCGALAKSTGNRCRNLTKDPSGRCHVHR